MSVPLTLRNQPTQPHEGYVVYSNPPSPIHEEGFSLEEIWGCINLLDLRDEPIVQATKMMGGRY